MWPLRQIVGILYTDKIHTHKRLYSTVLTLQFMSLVLDDVKFLLTCISSLQGPEGSNGVGIVVSPGKNVE